MSENYCPRLSINITTVQRQKLDKFLPWGTQKKVFGVIVDDLISLFESHGAQKVLGAYLSRHLTLEEISKLKVSD